MPAALTAATVATATLLSGALGTAQPCTATTAAAAAATIGTQGPSARFSPTIADATEARGATSADSIVIAICSRSNRG